MKNSFGVIRFRLLTKLFVLAIVSPTLMARAATVTVPGTANPWLAGMPDGSVGGCSFDTAPGQSPVLFTGLPLVPGSALFISAFGTVNNGSAGTVDGPDGSTLVFQIVTRPCGAENGIADLHAPINALLGVFLDDSRPSLSPAPSPFNGSSEAAVVAPGLRQAFIIGDGMTSSALPQQFVVPEGATRLFLGTMDGYEWNNNGGQFVVDVVPEPRGIVLLGVGLATMFVFSRMRRTK